MAAQRPGWGFFGHRVPPCVAALAVSLSAMASTPSGGGASAASPIPQLQDPKAVHVLCLGSGLEGAEALAEKACLIAVGQLSTKGYGSVSPLRLGDERTGDPQRLIVGLRVNLQPAPSASGSGVLAVVSGQIFRGDRPGGRLVPAAAQAVIAGSNGADQAYAAAIAAILTELGF